MTQLLAIMFSRIKQPRVIAEVIAGILLGPTVMGRIPNFSQTIFPPESLPFLSLVSTIGMSANSNESTIRLINRYHAQVLSCSCSWWELKWTVSGGVSERLCE